MGKIASVPVKLGRASSGLGLIAMTAISEGAEIVQYTGSIMSNEESDKKRGKYQFAISNKEVIDGSGRDNLGRYVNHACHPNAEAIVNHKQIWIYAIRDIGPGEEITIDYGEDYFVTLIKPRGCKCVSCHNG